MELAGPPEGAARVPSRDGEHGRAGACVGRRAGGVLALAPLGLLYAALFVVPMVGIVLVSLTPSRVVGASGPLANYLYLMGRAVYQETLVRTVSVSIVVAVLAAALAVPTALALRRLPSRLLGAAMLLLVMPMLIGPLVLALGWLAVLSAGGPLALLLREVGLPSPTLVGRESGVVIALTHYGLPFTTLVLLAGLLQVDHDLEGAAAIDGAGRWQVFRFVTWPLALPAVLAGALLAMLLALSAYVTPQYLGGGARPVLTSVVAQYVLGTFDRPLAATAAMLLMGLSAVVALVWPKRSSYAMESDGRRGPGGRRDRPSDLATAGWLAVLLVFLLAPLGVIVVGSLSQDALFPGPVRGMSIRWYARVLTESAVLTAARLSLGVAAAASVLALLVSLPAAFRLSRQGPRWLPGLLTAPLAAPQLALGLGVLGLVTALSLPSAPLGLILAHAAFVTPVMLRALLAALEGLDPTIFEAAAVDGAGPLRVLVLVVLPLLRPGLVSGTALTFALSFTNVPLSLFLATPQSMPLPILMLARLETHLDPGLAALSVLVMACAVPSGVFVARVVGIRPW